MHAPVPSAPRFVDYLSWAFSVPGTATYDLSQSGMPDAVRHDERARALARAFAADAALDRSNAATILDGYRRAAADRYGLAPDHIVPTLGTSGALSQALLALCRPGDAIIVERPVYEPLWRVPEALGLSVTPFERTFEDEWRLDPARLARLLSSRTRLVVVSNLHNPTGVATDRTTLSEIAALAARVDAHVLVDEVYLDFVPDASSPPSDDDGARVHSGVHVADNVIVASSMTKTLGFGALRAGWLACRDTALATRLARAAELLHVVPPLPSVALATALSGEADHLLEHARRTAAEGRRVLARFLTAQNAVRAVVPRYGLCAALVLPPDVRATNLADHLRRRYDTIVVPGTFFEAPHVIRVGLGGQAHILEQGLANVVAAIEDLRPAP